MPIRRLGQDDFLPESDSVQEMDIKDFEYLLHHIVIDGENEEVHHCYLYDHLGNLFEQGHLTIEQGKVYLDGVPLEDGVYHIISNLEPSQDVAWSEDMAAQNGIRSKNMAAGMSFEEKAKEW